MDELLILAWALDVAPVHLLVPTEVDDSEQYPVTPERSLKLPLVRDWIRGDRCPAEIEGRLFYSQVPASEFRAD